MAEEEKKKCCIKCISCGHAGGCPLCFEQILKKEKKEDKQIKIVFEETLQKQAN